MRRLISIGCALWILAGGVTWAQALPPNDAGVSMGHWHLNTPDVEASKKVFVTLGGTAITVDGFEIVRFPGVAVYLHLRPGAAAPAGGTVGTVVNHVAFMVQNVQESVARWKAAGVTVLPGGNDRTDQAFVMTPDAVRIEILEDKGQPMPIRHHHIHFNVPESAIKEMQSWYAKTFGATPGMRGQNVAADIPGANLSFGATATPTVTTKGRSLDHIGFNVRNLEAFVKQLEAAGVKIDRPYTKDAQTGNALAFIYDPWGTYIELNERTSPL